MKLYRKVFFFFLAVLPFLPVFIYCISNFAYGDFDLLSLGSVSFVDSVNGVSLVTEPGTWSELLLVPLFGSDPMTGLFGSLARLCLWIQTNVGITLSAPLVFAVYYFVAEFILWVLEFIFDLISFVPRKCLEVFR